MQEFKTDSQNLDVQSIAELCDDIAREDWHKGALESKLALIILLAERVEKQRPIFKNGHLNEGM